MKKLIHTAVIFCFFLQNVLAQSTDFRNQMNTIFEHVDLSQVPSGILFDYGLNLVDDSLYNGVLIDDNILSPQVWKSLYADLWSSQVTDTITIPDIEDINDAIDSYSLDTVSLIPVLFYNYHRISPEALDSNLMYISNDQIYDTPGRLESPYISQVAFAATSMQSRFETTNGIVGFVFQQGCYFSNSGVNVSSIEVDADDGQGYRQAQWGSIFSCSYASGGDKDVKVKFTFSDNSTLYSHFTITVDINIPLKSAQYYNVDTLSIDPADVMAYNGQKATGVVSVIYNGATTVLDKPLIVFEGYDTWKILSPDNPENNITWESLLDGIHGTQMGYFTSTFQSNLSTRGYDIVFVDYDNGTDYIQRNAYFAEAVINTVNQLKSGNEPNVVMGISMGGLVARYALADMEANSEDHDTRLFISMDSPHQGANVPLGLQAMTRHLTDVKVEVGKPGITAKIWDIGATYPEYTALINLLQQPATRQMLIQQLSDFGEDIYVDNSIHNTFMQEYEQLGYPTQCRNIAVSNGSGSTSTSWQYTPASDIFSLSADCTGAWWTSYLSGYIIIASSFVKQLWEMPIVTLASLLPGNYGIKANFDIKALPYSGTTKVYDGEIKIVKKILWLISVSSTLTSKEINYTGDNMPWSSSQGGFMSFDTYTGDIPSNLPSCVDLTLPAGNFCFVPAVSSLDIQGTQDLLNGYTAESDLPNSMFDNIYTEPSINRVHTNFNTGNSQWIILELDEDSVLLQQSLTYKFNGCELSGPDIVCSGGATFSISNLPSGVSLLWNKSSNLTEDSSGDDYIVLTANSSGEGWVQAELSGGGATVFSESKDVWVGTLESTYVSGQYQVCPDCYYTYTAQVPGGHSSSYTYNWTYPSNWIVLNQWQNYIRLKLPYSNPDYGTVRVSVTNECGASEYSGITVYPGNCGKSYSLSFSPNPTTGETIIRIEQAEVTGETIESATVRSSFDYNTEWSLEVYSKSQVLTAKETGLKGKEAKIQTSGWKEGVYIVRVIYKDEVLQGKLVVKR